MAVQAQYLSSVFWPALQTRISSIDNQGFAPPATGLQESQSAPSPAANLFRASQVGLNFVQQPLFNGRTVLDGKDNQSRGSLPNSRKRSRQSNDAPAKISSLINMADPDSTGPASLPNMIPKTEPMLQSLRVSLDDARSNVASAFPVTNVSAGSSVLTILSGEVQSCMSKQREEMEKIIKIEEERLKQVLDEMTTRHTTAFLSAIDLAVCKRLKKNEDDLDKATRRNAELQETVKQLSRQLQLWQNIARNSELMASNLRTSLTQAMAQSKEQSKEGCGESEVDDAESCQIGECNDLHSRTIKENRELKERRLCRVCNTNDVGILLLPCRHLCLCKDCEGRHDACPVCQTTKNASVQVHMP